MRVDDIVYITESQNLWRMETLNLIASENVMSPLALSVYVSDFMHRYAEGKPFKRYYQGAKYIDVLEDSLNKEFAEVMEASYSDIRPISGTIANASVFRVLAPPGEKAVIAPVQAGAHVSHTKFGTLGALGIEHIEMPYDEERMNVDVDRAVKLIEEVEPRFAVLGGSVYLFPHPVKEIGDAIHSVGGKLVYDAAHVLGLIVGRRWRNPFPYADVVTGSTHKTFPGPQGGVVFFRDEELYKKVTKTIFPWFLSNHHLHRVPATYVTLKEMEVYGEAYAGDVVSNAKYLAEFLVEEGINVVGEELGYTESHQVLIDVGKKRGGTVAKRLEEAGIIANKNLLPWDDPSDVKNPSGIRLGTQEVTRWGMGKEEMREVARLIADVVLERRDPREVRDDVRELRKQFSKVHYCFPGKTTTLLDLLS